MIYQLLNFLRANRTTSLIWLVAIILNIGLWPTWLILVKQSLLPVITATFILVVNLVLTVIVFRRDELSGILLGAVAALVQILTLILTLRLIFLG